MRKTLVIMLALCGSACYAQKIEFGLNAGMTPYSAINEKKFNATDIQHTPGYYSSARASLAFLGWQAGISIEKMQVRSVATGLFNHAILKYNYLNPGFFVNKLIKLPKGYLYAGITGGPSISRRHEKFTIDDVTEPYIHIQKLSGFNAGAQIGYTAYVFKNFGVNAEVATRYIKVTDEARTGYDPVVEQLTFPISLGLRYRL